MVSERSALLCRLISVLAGPPGVLTGLGSGLLCALCISATPLLLVWGNAGDNPLLFFVNARLVAGSLHLLAFLSLSFASRGWGFVRLGWRLLRMLPRPVVLLILLGQLDGLMFAVSSRWVHPSLGVVLFEAWPALLVVMLFLLPATRDRYRSSPWVLFPCLVAVYLGVVVVMAGYAGGFAPLFADRGARVFLGGGVALLGGVVGALGVLGSFLWTLRVREVLARDGWPQDSALAAVVSTFFLVAAMNVPTVLGGLLLLRLQGGGLLQEGVSAAPLVYGFFLFLGTLSVRLVNLLGSSLAANAVIYLGPPMGVLWLVLSVGVGVVRWDLFVSGMAVVAGLNLLLQVAPWWIGFKGGDVRYTSV